MSISSTITLNSLSGRWLIAILFSNFPVLCLVLSFGTYSSTFSFCLAVFVSMLLLDRSPLSPGFESSGLRNVINPGPQKNQVLQGFPAWVASTLLLCLNHNCCEWLVGEASPLPGCQQWLALLVCYTHSQCWLEGSAAIPAGALVDRVSPKLTASNGWPDYWWACCWEGVYSQQGCLRGPAISATGCAGWWG